MKNQIVRIFLAVLMLALPITSHAFEIAVEGGISIDNPSVSALTAGATAPVIGSKSSIAYGVSAGYSLFPGLQLETGLMYLPRHFTTTDASNLIDISFNNMLVPLLVRFTALPLVTVAAGAYYAMGTGQVTSTTTPVGGSAQAAVLSDFDTTTGGIKKSGMGLMGSVRLGVPIFPLVDFLIDGRYLMDLGDRSANTALSAKFKDMQILAGISFGI